MPRFLTPTEFARKTIADARTTGHRAAAVSGRMRAALDKMQGEGSAKLARADAAVAASHQKIAIGRTRAGG